MRLGRARGWLLRLSRQRALSVGIGMAMLLPALWFELVGRYAGWVDGVSLVLGATGVALIWTGVRGPRPDWLDDN